MRQTRRKTSLFAMNVITQVMLDRIPLIWKSIAKGGKEDSLMMISSSSDDEVGGICLTAHTNVVSFPLLKLIFYLLNMDVVYLL